MVSVGCRTWGFCGWDVGSQDGAGGMWDTGWCKWDVGHGTVGWGSLGGAGRMWGTGDVPAAEPWAPQCYSSAGKGVQWKGHACVHASAHAHACMHTHTHAHACMHTHVHALAHACTWANTAWQRGGRGRAERKDSIHTLKAKKEIHREHEASGELPCP